MKKIVCTVIAVIMCLVCLLAIISSVETIVGDPGLIDFRGIALAINIGVGIVSAIIAFKMIKIGWKNKK